MARNNNTNDQQYQKSYLQLRSPLSGMGKGHCITPEDRVVAEKEKARNQQSVEFEVDRRRKEGFYKKRKRVKILYENNFFLIVIRVNMWHLEIIYLVIDNREEKKVSRKRGRE